MHRAAVDNDCPGIHAMGLFIADIVPFIAEYESFANPQECDWLLPLELSATR